MESVVWNLQSILWKGFKEPFHDETTPWLLVLKATLETGVVAEDSNGGTWHNAFHHAVNIGHQEAVQLFLKHGADPNLKVQGDPIILTAIHRSHRDVFDTLVAAGAEANWNTQGASGSTALRYAMQAGDPQLARKLLVPALASGSLTKDDIDSLLKAAACAGHIEAARLLLDACADAESPFHAGFFISNCNALTAEDVARHIGMLEVLLGYGASAGEALFEAVIFNDSKAMQWLLDHGINIDTPNRAGKTALMAAVKHHRGGGEVLDFILAHGANVNYVSPDGATALSLTADPSRYVKILLDAGADPNAGFGKTALMNVARWHAPETAELLLQAGANINTVLEDGETALRVAERSVHESVAKLLKAAGAVEPDLSRTDLRAAMLWNRTGDALRLIDEGADIEQLDTYGRTPLLAALLEECDNAVVERLLEKGANPNCSFREHEGSITPMILATAQGRSELVRLLLDHGASVESTGDANSLLQGAIVSILDYDTPDRLIYSPHDESFINVVGIVRLLLEAGVPPNIQGGAPNTLTRNPLQLAVLKDITLLELLVEHGAHLDVQSFTYGRPRRTALHDACSYTYLEAVQFLLEHGANPNTLSSDGTTPLIDACTSPQWSGEDRERFVNGARIDELTGVWEHDERVYLIVKMLLDYGADVNLGENDPKRSVLRAARSVRILTDPRCALIRMLIDAGAMD